MKKVLFMAALAVSVMAFVGCNNKAASKSSALADSVSMSFGDLYGNGMVQGLRAQDSTMNMDMVLKGVEYIMRADTSDHAFMNGIQIGMQVMQMYQGIRQQYGINIDKQLFLQHFAAALKAKTPMTQAEMQALQQRIEPLMQRAAAEARANDPALQELKKKGEEFAKAKEKEGFTKTASGLLYKVEKPGEGANFTDGDRVMVKYRGTHVNGEEFDKSPDAVAFDLRQVVPGFAEIIKLMKPGAKVTAVLPYNLAYGEEGSRNPMSGEMIIKPFETLVFEIETVGLAPAENGKTPGVPTARPQK